MSMCVLLSSAAKCGGETLISVGAQGGMGLLQRLLTSLQEIKSQRLSDVLAVSC